ncbi:MAG: hypothetical protein E7574_02225 [Ruminococcaceae bacterium]|nr:hypothetical protein [Oscillospiraceae bacterium]
MFFPKLKPYKLTENTISTFGGIDRTSAASENFFSNTQNTTSSLFPILSTREKRSVLTSLPEKPSALHTTNGITYVIGTSLYYNGVLQYDKLEENTKKQIVSMGSKIIVFPDNYYIDTMTLNEDKICVSKGFLHSKNILSYVSVSLTPCIAGRPYPIVLPKTPQQVEDGALWLDSSVFPNQLYIYSATNNTWTSIASTHICILADHIHMGLKIGDGIEISNLGFGMDGYHTVADMEYDQITVPGYIDKVYGGLFEGQNRITIERAVPVMDFVCEHQNRLFGCRYGLNNKGEFVNEIYASKHGDPTNWNVYQGISTDSYTASCGSEGEFTGIASHMGNVLFFKENSIHRLFGTKPSNFTVYNDKYPGIKKHSENSVCNHNGTLFYHSNDGIYSYSGSAPILISKPLGNEIFSHAVAAVGKNTYFICLTDSYQTRHLYAYDIVRNLWHRHDSTDYMFFSKYDGNILSINHTQDGYNLELLFSSEIPELCQTLYSDSLKTENNFDWFAESGLIGLSFDDCKYLNKLKVRIEISEGSSVSVFIQTDSNNNWELFDTLTSSKLTTRILHILPPRCDHFKLKFAGKGDFKLYSLTKVIEKAGEVV